MTARLRELILTLCNRVEEMIDEENAETPTDLWDIIVELREILEAV